MMGQIGGIASVVGAAIAIWQARRAKHSADRADEVRSQLIRQRQTSDISSLTTVARRILAMLAKYGPGACETSLAGVNRERDASEIQDFCGQLKEHREYFGMGRSNAADALYMYLMNDALPEFRKAQDDTLLKRVGGQMLQHLNELLPRLKHELDSSRESVS